MKRNVHGAKHTGTAAYVKRLLSSGTGSTIPPDLLTLDTPLV
jgi:hypothetical protein